jgi:adenylate kinase family enzyme
MVKLIYKDESEAMIRKAPTVKIISDGTPTLMELEEMMQAFIIAMGFSKDITVTIDVEESENDIQISESK